MAIKDWKKIRDNKEQIIYEHRPGINYFGDLIINKGKTNEGKINYTASYFSEYAKKYQFNKSFKTRQQVLKYAKEYMKKH